MTTPIPVLLLGKAPGHLKAVSDIVKPDHEVISQASTVEDAKANLRSLVSDSGSPQIRLAMMGGGFSPSDFEEVLKVPGAKSIPWMRPDMKFMPGNGQPPSADNVAQRVRVCLDNHSEELQTGKGAGEVWSF